MMKDRNRRQGPKREETASTIPLFSARTFYHLVVLLIIYRVRIIARDTVEAFFFLELNSAKILLFVQFHSDQFAARSDLQHVQPDIGVRYDDLEEFMGFHLLDQLACSQQRKRSEAFTEIDDVIRFLFHFRSDPLWLGLLKLKANLMPH